MTTHSFGGPAAEGREREASTQAQDRPDPWSFLRESCDVYFRLGIQINDSKPLGRLVALASAVKELSTKVVSSDGQDLVCAWKDLPITGMELSERWHRVRNSRAQALTAIVLALEANVNKQMKKHEVPVENVIAGLLPAASHFQGHLLGAATPPRSC
ncbi:hypothetical protein diail_5790 [Diaporthe ilicicola]|nr:hypothetical protein diail_5790 [Diaporthe ilicicola]